MIHVHCTSCGKRFHVRDGLAGKKARCGHCGHFLLVPDGPFVQAAAPAPQITPPAESTPEQSPSPVRSFFGFVVTAVRLVLLAVLLAAVGGAAGDLLAPLAPVNLIAAASLAGLAVLLLILALALGSPRMGLAFLFLLCLGAGFGGWWAMAEFHAGKPRGFLAQRVGLLANLQASVLKDRAPTRDEAPARTATDSATARSQPEPPAQARPRAGKLAADAPAGQARVIAEGTGTSLDGARKDALRNAVRQVVGAFVDEETRIKDEDVIADQVLTYSDGFVKNYEELGQQQDGGLYRLKIRADVERRAVVERLRAANVTVKEVNGKGLFSEVFTQLDAEKNARALVENALKDFPLNCLQAEAEGKPEVVDKSDDKVTIAVKVRLRPRLKEFDQFTARLIPVLEKVAHDKGDFSLTASQDRTGALDLGDRWQAQQALPRYFDHNSGYPETEKGLHGAIVLAVNTQRTRNMDRTEWRYFLLDRSVRPVLAATCACVFTVKVSLLDQDGALVAVDRFPALHDKRADTDWEFRASCLYPGTIVNNNFDFFTGYGGRKSGFYKRWYEHLAPSRKDTYGENFFLIAPLFFDESGTFRSRLYRPDAIATRKITLALDEIKRVESIKCELLFDEGELPPKGDVLKHGNE